MKLGRTGVNDMQALTANCMHLALREVSNKDSGQPSAVCSDKL
jgi:hypothetical protein